MTTKPLSDRPVGKPPKPTTAKTVASVATPPKDASQRPPGGKLGILVGLLRRPAGATLAEMMTATGWQGHSVRGAMAGGIKKKLGATIVSSKDADVRSWRITDASV
jgi:hypothetical protein